MVCAAAHELGQRGLDIVSCHAQRAGVVVAGAEGDDPQLGAGLTRKGHEAADHLVDHTVSAEGKMVSNPRAPLAMRVASAGPCVRTTSKPRVAEA